MPVLVSQERVNLNSAIVVSLLDIVLVPLEFGKVLDGSSDVAKALSSRLWVLVHSLHCLHAQLSHYSAE